MLERHSKTASSQTARWARMTVLALATAASGPAVAKEQAFSAGVVGGYFGFDALEFLNQSYVVTPRVGYWFKPSIGIEADLGISSGSVDIDGPQHLSFMPHVQFVGIPTDQSPWIRPLLSVGLGVLHKGVEGVNDQGFSFDHTRTEAVGSVGAGLLFPIASGIEARSEARVLITGAERNDLYASPFVDIQVQAGLQYRAELSPDTDGDKIRDDRDLCPNEAEDKDNFRDDDGCPEPDNDGDGLVDTEDSCPDDPEDIDNWEDTNGCPDPDNDGDTFLDAVDDCPDVAGIRELNGCPDADGDGVTDAEDNCPDTPGTLQGCPDADGDLVIDSRDKCPNEPGPKDADPEHSDGCPAEIYATNEGVLKVDQIYFATGSSRLLSKSNATIRDIAALLEANPSIAKVRVEGHTDSAGRDDTNMRLSERRAASVAAALVKAGVSEDRIESQGYGETQPIADNNTQSGRAANRRVVFRLLDASGEVQND